MAIFFLFPGGFGSRSPIIEAFYGDPPERFLLTKIAGFKNRLPVVSPEIRLSVVTPTSSIDRPLHTRENMWTLFYQWYPLLVSISHETLVCYTKLMVSVGGYRS